ncbi:MAG: thioredoxin family protein [Desulfuromonadaceae bacterium]|nr:thioredoxin family protein [Desulfuromonadaceae bacterium]
MRYAVTLIQALVLVMLMLPFTVWAEANWMENYQQALFVAKDQGKPLLLDFTGSDWCHWCIKLEKEVFSQPEFADYAAGNLVLVRVDFPKWQEQSEELVEQNEDLARKFRVRGFPTVVLLDPDGNKIATTGYQESDAAAYVEHLKRILAGRTGH